MRKHLQSGSSGPFAENAWTARYFGTGPTWRRSCSISNIPITSIACTPDANDTRRRRASTPIAHEQILVVIDGRSMVEAHTKRRLPRDFGIFVTDTTPRVIDIGKRTPQSSQVPAVQEISGHESESPKASLPDRNRTSNE
jgi:hypothetical protein